jgi:hypothetical protein
MKRAAVAAFVVIFALVMVHYFFAEDHCPVHCPTKGGRLGHVHQHHAGAATCLCFWSALMGPESDEFVVAADLTIMAPAAASVRVRGSLGVDIAHPPKNLPV